MPFYLLTSTLLLLTTLPAGQHTHNRLYHVLMVPPADLAMEDVLTSTVLAKVSATVAADPAATTDRQRAALERSRVFAPHGIAYVLNSTGAVQIPVGRTRKMPPFPPAAQSLGTLLKITQRQRPAYTFDPFFPASALYTPRSTTARLSGHWSSVRVALDHAGQSELAGWPKAPTHPPQLWLEWWSPRDNRFFRAHGAGQDLATPPRDDRGRLDSGQGNQVIRVGDILKLRFILKTFDGNRQGLTYIITHPDGTVSRRAYAKTPDAYDSWAKGIVEDDDIAITLPGRYDVEITGTTLWPSKTWTVTYHLVAQM